MSDRNKDAKHHSLFKDALIVAGIASGLHVGKSVIDSFAKSGEKDVAESVEKNVDEVTKNTDAAHTNNLDKMDMNNNKDLGSQNVNTKNPFLIDGKESKGVPIDDSVANIQKQQDLDDKIARDKDWDKGMADEEKPSVLNHFINNENGHSYKNGFQNGNLGLPYKLEAKQYYKDGVSNVKHPNTDFFNLGF